MTKKLKLIPIEVMRLFYQVVSRFNYNVGKYIVIDSDNDLMIRVCELNKNKDLEEILPNMEI